MQIDRKSGETIQNTDEIEQNIRAIGQSYTHRKSVKMLSLFLVVCAVLNRGFATYIHRPNRVCPGHEIRSLPVWNAGQCETECDADCTCRAFYLQKSTCYLKSQACTDFDTRPSKIGHDYVRTVFGSQCPCEGRKYHYIHRQYKLCQGHDITTFKVSKTGSAVKQCQDACSRNCLCKSIQLHKTTCWLKNYACTTVELKQLKPPMGNDYVKIEIVP